MCAKTAQQAEMPNYFCKRKGSVNWSVRKVAHQHLRHPLVQTGFRNSTGTPDNHKALRIGMPWIVEKLQEVPFDQLLAESDVVTLHPNVTPETKNMIGRAQIAQMKRGSCIVNTLRGQVLDYAALYDALVSGQLRGGALDCFEPEPPPRSSKTLRAFSSASHPLYPTK